MKICIFGAASAHIDDIYIKAVEELGEKLAKRGHTLVFGAGATGLMGAAARGFKRGGGFIHGVIPEFFSECGVEIVFNDCDKITYTETMSERKKTMEDMADVFIILPGGLGTLEEFFEAFTLLQVGRHNKPLIIFNIYNFYDDLEKCLRNISKKNFITSQCLDMCNYFTRDDEIIKYLDTYKSEEISWRDLLFGYKNS